MKTVLLRMLDVVLLPFTAVASLVMLAVRRIGVQNVPACKKAMLLVGVFPIRRHYYEPLFDTESLRTVLERPRHLPGIDLNIEEQLALLSAFKVNAELLSLPLKAEGALTFHYHNSRFGPGDAELFYSIIRHFKPRHMVEIGSGHSTRIARQALARNSEEDPAYRCIHTCIEPYEEPWLEECGANIIRERVEVVDKRIFDDLDRNDILFIDSSHMIRPAGDVLCEYLQILPRLKPGVLVHVHDIFTPRDYPAAWVSDDIRFWNEQYLLEAFLCHNQAFKIISALNFLKHNYPTETAARFPILAKEMWREPGSFWMRRD